MYECTWIVPSTELYKIADELYGLQLTFVRM